MPLCHRQTDRKQYDGGCEERDQNTDSRSGGVCFQLFKDKGGVRASDRLSIPGQEAGKGWGARHVAANIPFTMNSQPQVRDPETQ